MKTQITEALNKIAQMSDSGNPETTIIRMKEIAVNALKNEQLKTIEPTDKDMIWALLKVTDIQQKRIEELEQLNELIEKVKELLNGYEQWEADIISNNSLWWPHAEEDAISGKLYEDMLVLQDKRNELKAALNKQ